MADPLVDRMVQDEKRRRPQCDLIPAIIFPEFWTLSLPIKSKRDLKNNTVKNSNREQRLAMVHYINLAHADQGGKSRKKYSFPMSVWLMYFDAPSEEIHNGHKKCKGWITARMVNIIVYLGNLEFVFLNICIHSRNGMKQN